MADEVCPVCGGEWRYGDNVPCNDAMNYWLFRCASGHQWWIERASRAKTEGDDGSL